MSSRWQKHRSKSFTVKGFEECTGRNCKLADVRNPNFRSDTERLIALADVILDAWRSYSDEASFIFAETGRSTTRSRLSLENVAIIMSWIWFCAIISPRRASLCVPSPCKPTPHQKENIGLIEVMGLTVLPARLKKEMAELEEAILCGADLRQNEVLAAHADWAEEFLTRHSEVNAENIHEIVQQEIGLVFMQVLEDAGVYKCTEDGRKGFERFIDRLNA
ncbi:MAG: hypothetical protein ACLRTA_08520 [Clostridia bacterium]